MRLARVAAVVALASAIPAARAEDEKPVERWYAQFHRGKKSGWSRTRVAHASLDGRAVWVTETESCTLRLDGEPLKTPMRFASRFVEDESGAVLSYETSADVGAPPGAQKREGVVKDGVVRATEDGKERRAPYPAGALGPAAIGRAQREGIRDGAEGEALRFSALDAAAERIEWKVTGMTGTFDALGRHVWLHRLVQNDSTTIPDEKFVDGQGREFGGTTNFGLISWVLAEEAVAKADCEPVELLTSRIIDPDRAIPTSPKPLRGSFRLSRKNGARVELPDEGGQRVVSRGEKGEVVVEVVAAEPPATLAILARPYAGKADMKRFLAAGPLVELGHERLAENASDAVHGLVNSLRCARAIEFHVKGSLRAAPAGPMFGTACEVLSSAAGDFTEAAVLAVALARANGIPARLVAGFVYWPADTWPPGAKPRGAFAFHTWAELLVAEGVWYPIDPMRAGDDSAAKTVDDLAGLGGFDATHIAVLRSDLATEKPFTDIAKPVLDLMDGLTIEFAEREGK